MPGMTISETKASSKPAMPARVNCSRGAFPQFINRSMRLSNSGVLSPVAASASAPGRRETAHNSAIRSNAPA